MKIHLLPFSFRCVCADVCVLQFTPPSVSLIDWDRRGHALGQSTRHTRDTHNTHQAPSTHAPLPSLLFSCPVPYLFALVLLRRFSLCVVLSRPVPTVIVAFDLLGRNGFKQRQNETTHTQNKKAEKHISRQNESIES